MTTRRSNRRPAPASSVVAVVVAAAVILALGSAGTGRWLAAELLGIGAVAAGAVAYRSGHRVPSVVVALVGAAGCVAAVGGFAARTGSPSELLRLLPGFFGVAALAAALIPIRGEGSRSLVKAGAGGVFACVVLAGLFRTADLSLLLGAAAGTVLAWDAGEHAVGVGQQLGRQARTWRLEATHVVGTALVGAAGVALVLVARGFTAGGLSLPSFAMAFVAVVLLAAALRR